MKAKRYRSLRKWNIKIWLYKLQIRVCDSFTCPFCFYVLSCTDIYTMSTDLNYIEINKALWDEKTRHHLTSAFYDVEGFRNGQSSLKDIELSLLGSIDGKKVLHLQCHFGQDTLSLARMGAQVTGVDLSQNAINAAKELATGLDLDARFICSDVYAVTEVLPGTFDIVFTSYGTIGWLPDMDKWAHTIAHYLKPGGLFVFAEFHPVMWMFDNDFTHIQYSYFNRGEIIENEPGTYADRNAPMQLTSVSWNHNLAEVMQALINAGMEIEVFGEYDYSPYNCVKNMVEISPGKYQIKGMEGKLPLVYSLRAIKK